MNLSNILKALEVWRHRRVRVGNAQVFRMGLVLQNGSELPQPGRPAWPLQGRIGDGAMLMKPIFERGRAVDQILRLRAAALSGLRIKPLASPGFEEGSDSDIDGHQCSSIVLFGEGPGFHALVRQLSGFLVERSHSGSGIRSLADSAFR